MIKTSHSWSYSGARNFPISWSEFYELISSIWGNIYDLQKNERFLDRMTFSWTDNDKNNYDTDDIDDIKREFDARETHNVVFSNLVSIELVPKLKSCYLQCTRKQEVFIKFSAADRTFSDKILSAVHSIFPEQNQSSFKNRSYINQERINELKALPKNNFDFKRLIEYCEEVNICASTSCWLAMAFLNRAILDHVPPIFGCTSFDQVASSYGKPNTNKSFKRAMEDLNKNSRNIADKNIHQQITKNETLPVEQQVDFSNELDLLLEEIVRIKP